MRESMRIAVIGIIGIACIFGTALATVGVEIHVAPADPKPGLWQEGTFTMNGESIQKFRDTTHGSNTACYLITRTYGGGGPANPHGEVASLSCVAEKKP